MLSTWCGIIIFSYLFSMLNEKGITEKLFKVLIVLSKYRTQYKTIAVSLINITIMVQNRDHNNKTVQMVTRSHFGASIGLSLLRSESYILQADNELASSRIILELYHLELFNDGYYYIKNFIVIFIERYSYSLKIPTHYMIHPLVDVD